MSSYNVEQADDNSLTWSGIGQYTDTVNPYHMMILMGAIANGGTPCESIHHPKCYQQHWFTNQKQVKPQTEITC